MTKLKTYLKKKYFRSMANLLVKGTKVLSTHEINDIWTNFEQEINQAAKTFRLEVNTKSQIEHLLDLVISNMYIMGEFPAPCEVRINPKHYAYIKEEYFDAFLKKLEHSLNIKYPYYSFRVIVTGGNYSVECEDFGVDMEKQVQETIDNLVERSLLKSLRRHLEVPDVIPED